MISVDFSALAYSLHTEDGWFPVTWENSQISTSLGQCLLRTASESAARKTLSDSHRLYIQVTSLPARQHHFDITAMDKKIHTLLTTLFFQVDDNVAFRDLGVRLSSSRTRPIPVGGTKIELRRVDGCFPLIWPLMVYCTAVQVRRRYAVQPHIPEWNVSSLQAIVDL